MSREKSSIQLKKIIKNVFFISRELTFANNQYYNISQE